MPSLVTTTTALARKTYLRTLYVRTKSKHMEAGKSGYILGERGYMPGELGYTLGERGYMKGKIDYMHGERGYSGHCVLCLDQNS